MSNIRLKINQKELVKHIELKSDYWINRKETNCYAFALGFDIPERNIMNGAYKVGVIGFTKEGIDLSKINIYSYEERLIKDLKTLKLIYEETSPEEIVKVELKPIYTVEEVNEVNTKITDKLTISTSAIKMNYFNYLEEKIKEYNDSLQNEE